MAREMQHDCEDRTMKLNRLRTLLMIIALILACPAVFIGYVYWLGTRWDARLPFDENDWRQAWSSGDRLDCFYMRHSLCLWLDANKPDALKLTCLLGPPTQVVNDGHRVDLASSESRYEVALLKGVCYYDFGLIPSLTFDEPCCLVVMFDEGRYHSSSFEHLYLPSVLQHLDK